MAIEMKISSRNVIVSNITMCNEKFGDKAMEANRYLKRFCIKKPIVAHYHKRNINNIKLHLINLGT